MKSNVYEVEIDGLMNKSRTLRNHARHEEASSLQWRALALADTQLRNRLWPLCSDIAESMLQEGASRYDDALVLLDHASEHLTGWQNNPVGQTLRQCHIYFIKGKIYTLKKQYRDADQLLLSSLFPICQRSGAHWLAEGQKLLADCYTANGHLSHADYYYQQATGTSARRDWLEAYHSLLERMGETSRAADVAHRIQEWQPPVMMACGHTHTEKDQWLGWEPTIAVTEEEYDRAVCKYKQAVPKSQDAGEAESDKPSDYQILIGRLLSHLANDAESEKFFVENVQLEAYFGGKFLLTALGQYREQLQNTGRKTELMRLDQTIEQIKMKFAHEF